MFYTIMGVGCSVFKWFHFRVSPEDISQKAYVNRQLFFACSIKKYSLAIRRLEMWDENQTILNTMGLSVQRESLREMPNYDTS